MALGLLNQETDREVPSQEHFSLLLMARFSNERVALAARTTKTWQVIATDNISQGSCFSPLAFRVKIRLHPVLPNNLSTQMHFAF